MCENDITNLKAEVRSLHLSKAKTCKFVGHFKKETAIEHQILENEIAYLRKNYKAQALTNQLKSSNQEIQILKRKNQPQAGGTQSGYDRGRGRGRGGQGRGRGGVNAYDTEFVKDRNTLCKGYNDGRCDDAGKCGLIHGCNRRVAHGVACKHPHRASEHQ